ncbi:NAD(P)H-dependent oxidoreductase [Polynucleobacter rarus]|jgi:nitroreductase|uniref:NAD(P)H-dependent oxidoreductase n=1 Tax=Polynucleobacter rarus TaxID=556055 RepID=UPI000D3E37B4|nr:NAD(P)H-dependent oxidoreductase [Polynucleobacter rarus]
MSLIEKLKWRYATKKMDSTKSVPKETVERILEAVRLSASSFGLQPYELFVISNKDLREKIKAVANNQSQITDCSYLVVFAAWDTYTEDRVNHAFDRAEEIRNNRSEATIAYRAGVIKNFTTRDPEVNFNHAAKQSYIGLGTALIAAAEEEIDATPMEGFNPAELDILLNLREKGLRSTVILPLGFRKADEDWLSKVPKVRKPKEEFLHWIE